jgi:GH24 family phage-related lysozyme (muramidase)
MNDDDLGNDSNGPSITPFANNLGQGGAGPGSPPPNSGSILDSWKSTGLGGDTLAMLLPQLDDASTTPLPAGPVYFGQSPPSLASTPTGNAPLSSLFSTGLGGDVIASMLPQRQDTGAALPSADASAAFLSSPVPGSSALSPAGATNDPAQVDQNTDAPKVTSDAGRQFIKNWEGYQDNIYPDAANNPTFGYGHKLTGADNTLADDLTGMTDDQKRSLADTMFDVDVNNHEQALYGQLGPDAINALTQNQFDALIAASYNGGVGPIMIGDIQKGDNDAAAGEFNAYYITKNVNGVPTKVVVQGLRDRNSAEKNMFVSGDPDAVFTPDDLVRWLYPGSHKLGGFVVFRRECGPRILPQDRGGEAGRAIGRGVLGDGNVDSCPLQRGQPLSGYRRLDQIRMLGDSPCTLAGSQPRSRQQG